MEFGSQLLQGFISFSNSGYEAKNCQKSKLNHELAKNHTERRQGKMWEEITRELFQRKHQVISCGLKT